MNTKESGAKQAWRITRARNVHAREVGSPLLWSIALLFLPLTNSNAVLVSAESYLAQGYKQYAATLNGITQRNDNYVFGACYYAWIGNVNLDLNTVYKYSLDKTNTSYCFSDTYYLVRFVTSGCSDVYVNGVKTNGYWHSVFLLHDECDVLIAPKTGIKFEYPKIDGIYTLIADGYSTASPSLSGDSLANLRFLILTNAAHPTALGCKIDAITGTLTAGQEEGTIVVRATNNVSGGCYSDERVELKKCGDGCEGADCGKLGAVQGANGSVDLKLGLGWATIGRNAGFLSITEDVPGLALYTPARLRYNNRRDKSEVDVVTDAQYVIQQIRVPEGLANVVTNATNSYSVQFYSAANVLAKTNGVYPLTNSPFTTITITNLNFDTNRFQISKDGEVLYTYNRITNGWEMISGGSLRKETKTAVTNGSLRTVTTTVSDGSNPAVYQSTETFTNSAGFGERLIAETFGTGNNARTNSYSYTTNGYYRQIVRSDGSWQYFLYDSKNRPTNIFSSFLNQGVTSNAALCRMTEYTYSTNVIPGSGDNFRIDTNAPRRTVEYLLGQEIARSYTVILPGERRDIQCVTPGAAWDTSGNLVTVTRFITNGHPYYLNAVQSVLQPDGTITIYQRDNPYQTNKTNVVLVGHPSDSYNTNIDDGTKTISIVGPLGQVLTNTVVDVVSGITLSREIYQYDSLNRLTNTAYLDGTFASAAYGCCTLDSEKDREGTLTSYGYDALKRRTITTRNSITVSNVYDPAGNILRTVRYGTDGSAITNRRAVYNDAGRMVSSTNALNSPTLYTNYFDGSGQLVNRTTSADGGTRIETHYRDSSLQSVTGSAVFPARYVYGVASDGGVQRAYTAEIKLNAAGGDTLERTTNYLDMVGRTYKTVYAAASGTPSAISYFNTKGQLTNTVDADGVSQLYAFHPKGEPAYSITDSNRDYTIDYSGNDRITYVTNDVVNNGTADVQRTRIYVWKTSANSSNLISTAEMSVDGLRSWNTIWNNGTAVTSQTRTVYDAANGYRYLTNIAPDNSYSVSITRYGTNVSQTAFDAIGGQMAQATFAYDAHGRLCKFTDARTGATTNYFNNADQISSVVTPVPATGQSSQVTTNYFDNMGRVWKTTLPDNTSVTNEYFLTGLLKKTHGSRAYPVEYTFDAQGRMKTMKTWKDFAGNSGAAITTWNHDLYRGWLTNKTYDGGAAGPVYTYTAAGRLAARAWARGTNTAYSYNHAGDLMRVDYSDSTPDVGYGYNRLGRQTTVTNNTTLLCTLAYNDLGQLLSETYSSGPLSGLGVTNVYDQLLRRTNVSTTGVSTGYRYDNASRLWQVLSGTNAASYAYLANSPLVSQIVFTNGSALRMTATKTYDNLNRVTSITNLPSGSSAVGFQYAYNSANQRTSVTNAESARWVYTYDSLGQVVSGKKYWSDGTPVAGQQFEYTFDDIGNRKTTASGGDAFGANLRYANYTASSLNQSTSRTVPGYVNMVGEATNTATVTLWSSSCSSAATSRKSNYYRGELLETNTSALWLTITNLAVLNNGTNADILASITGNVFLPRTAEAYTYDADGNLTSDGRWTNRWDAENRLIQMESLADAPSNSKRKLTFAYDHRGRRTEAWLYVWTGSAYGLSKKRYFVYDDWNLIAALAHEQALTESFLWGLDLSGTMQGAGGVGGLLQVSFYGTQTTNCFAAYDGNGNVSALINAADGKAVAQYEYGPFGELLRATGPAAKANPFLFSTKYYDWETGFYYYGYRYYDPSTGRWLSRDPIEEDGGPNLYGFVFNNPYSYIDRNGLDSLGLWDRPPNTDVLGNPLPGHPRYAEYRLETALAFHVTAALGSHATWDSAMRAMYHAADEKVLSGIRQLVSEGIITQEQGVKLYADKVNKLVVEFRDKSSPIGRFVAEHLKSRNNLPTAEKILAKKSAEQVLSKAHANERVGSAMQKVGKLGRACTVISIGIGVYTVSSAEPDQRPRVATRVVGEFSGSVGGAWAGGAAGGAIGGANWGSRGGIWGAVIGTITGAVAGGAAGGAIAGTTYDVFVDD